MKKLKLKSFNLSDLSEEQLASIEFIVCYRTDEFDGFSDNMPRSCSAGCGSLIVVRHTTPPKLLTVCRKCANWLANCEGEA